MRIGFYATCLVDQLFPQVGRASVALLQSLGCDVIVPTGQTCCGQPVFNAGHAHDATSAARRLVAMMTTHPDVEAWVVPSGSCADMIVHHYRDVLPPEDVPAWEAQTPKVFELAQFIATVLKPTQLPSAPAFAGRVAYHDSCHLLRGMGIAEEPRALLRQVQGLDLVDLDPKRECCGFGGTFSVTYPEISADMMATKLRLLQDLDPPVQALTAGDCGCLLHLTGGIRRADLPIKTYHYAQLLAGAPYTDEPL